MAINTTYSLDADVAVKGMVADSRVGFSTRTVVLAADIAPGFLVTLAGALPSAQGDYIAGATRWSTTIPQDESGNITYKSGKAVPVITDAPIWLQARDAVAAGDLVYAMISTNAGDIKKTAGADTTTKPVGRAETAGAVGELVRVKLMDALQGA